LCLSVAVTSAQQTSTKSETKEFEIIAVAGNDLVVKVPEGTREVVVPPDFKFTVDGKQLSVRELKPGMKGTATVTTKTTLIPVTVTEVKNGTVLQQTGMSIIVRTDEGIKSFTQSDVDKRGVKIMRGGKPATISDFRNGDKLSATIVTTKPPQVMTEQEVQATLAKAPPAPAPARAPAAAPAMPSSAPAAAPPPAAPPARKLPKTASPLPLVGLSGLASLLGATALLVRRRLY